MMKTRAVILLKPFWLRMHMHTAKPIMIYLYTIARRERNDIMLQSNMPLGRRKPRMYVTKIRVQQVCKSKCGVCVSASRAKQRETECYDMEALLDGQFVCS